MNVLFFEGEKQRSGWLCMEIIKQRLFDRILLSLKTRGNFRNQFEESVIKLSISVKVIFVIYKVHLTRIFVVARGKIIPNNE